MTYLVLVRHGQTVWHAENRYAGSSVVALTTRGQDAASQYLAVVLGWFAEALSDWPAEDRRDLTRLLARMVDDLSAHLASLD